MPDARHQTIMRVPHTVHQRCSGHSTANIRRKALRLSDLRVLLRGVRGAVGSVLNTDEGVRAAFGASRSNAELGASLQYRTLGLGHKLPDFIHTLFITSLPRR